MGALAEALEAAAADTSVRVVILAAEGNVYSSGHDLKEMTARRAEGDKGAASFAALFRQCSALMQQIVTLPKPVIAEVQGTATAAGCQLVASCDLAVASEAARFATPGVDIGLFCSTPMVALSRSIGRKHAMEMLLTGEPINANDARQAGSGQSRGCVPPRLEARPWRWRRRSPPSRAPRCAPARKPSTARSKCRWPRLMIMPHG